MLYPHLVSQFANLVLVLVKPVVQLGLRIELDGLGRNPSLSFAYDPHGHPVVARSSSLSPFHSPCGGGNYCSHINPFHG
jgi:hypothetical protein